jgi:DNA-binding transcriptional regulator YiaG
MMICDYCGHEISTAEDAVSLVLYEETFSTAGQVLPLRANTKAYGQFHEAGCWPTVSDALDLTKEVGQIAEERATVTSRSPGAPSGQRLACPDSARAEGPGARGSTDARRRRMAEGTSLSDVGLTPRARHALIAADIVTLEDVAKRSEGDLLVLEGIGPRSLEQLDAALEQYGLPRLRRNAALIGERLRALRLAAALSHTDLARLLREGIYISDVQAWEHGRRVPDDAAAAQLAEIFGVTVDHLLAREEETT